MGIAERKEREKQQRRKEILDAAEKVFFSKGYELANVDEIAELAELSKGTIYIYFKNKADLLEGVFMRGMDILKDMMIEGIQGKETGYEKLIEMGLIFIRFSKEYSDYFNIFSYYEGSIVQELSIDEEEFKKHIMEDSPLPLVVECVENGIKDGSLRTDIPAIQLATTLWLQMLGILIAVNTKTKVIKYYDISVEDIFLTHLETISNGIKTKH